VFGASEPLGETTFDPLSSLSAEVAALAVKQRVRNIIRSYHHAADVLMEPIQNAVDEVTNCGAAVGKIRVLLDLDTGRIEVLDNGSGMTLDEARRFIAPDQGDKAELFSGGKVRGHKGVGLTFLAYGFNQFELESRTEDEHFRIRLSGARSWVEDNTSGLEDAPTAVIEMDPAEPRVESTGVSLLIQVGPQTQPSSLGHAFASAEYAETVLRSQTAIGIVPPWDPPVDGLELEVELEYRRNSRSSTRRITPEYLFPHAELEQARMRILDLAAYREQHPNATEPPASLRKKHHSCHWTIRPTELQSYVAEDDPEVFETRDELLAKIDQLGVHVYGLFAFSAEYRDTVAEQWSVPGNRSTHYPGFRIATDSMISSWRREPSLSHRGFYVDRVWLVYHFRQVEPDMGRKDFPPEVLEIVNATEEGFTNALTQQSLPFLKPAPKARRKRAGTEEPLQKATRRLDESPMVPGHLPGLDIVNPRTLPEEEQDVVVLFSTLVGARILGHLQVVYLSGHDDYDGWFQVTPDRVCEALNAALPGAPDLPERALRGVIEFKLRGSDLIDDIVNETKEWSDINLLICWELGANPRTLGGDQIQFVEAEAPDERRYAGVTHVATLQSKGDASVAVVELASLLSALSA
jgi:hypothetical protein